MYTFNTTTHVLTTKSVDKQTDWTYQYTSLSQSR